MKKKKIKVTLKTKKPKKKKEEVSGPFEIKLLHHVNYDNQSGFSGLPEAWLKLAEEHGISLEDLNNNKEAFAAILEFTDTPKLPPPHQRDLKLGDLVNTKDNPEKLYKIKQKNRRRSGR